MYLSKISWTNNTIHLNDTLLPTLEGNNALEWCTFLYQQQAFLYPKFFKMDIVSKVGFLAAELLLQTLSLTDKEKDTTALYIATSEGCLEVDKKFQDSMATHASPALFVYTLPNIVLGEICIKQKFKGEQLCYAAPALDIADMEFYIKDIFKNRNQSNCLAGYIDATEDKVSATLYWYTKSKDE